MQKIPLLLLQDLMKFSITLFLRIFPASLAYISFLSELLSSSSSGSEVLISVGIIMVEAPLLKLLEIVISYCPLHLTEGKKGIGGTYWSSISSFTIT